MNYSIFYISLLSFAASTAMAGVSNIGILASKSGWAQSEGMRSIYGARAAVALLNELHQDKGESFELQEFDDESSLEAGKRAAIGLSDRKISGLVLSSFSFIARDISSVLAKQGLPVIATVTGLPEFIPNEPSSLFRIQLSAPAEAKAGAWYFKTHMDGKRFAVIQMREVIGEVLAREFSTQLEKDNKKTVQFEFNSTFGDSFNGPKFRDILLRVQEEAFDGVYAIAYEDDAIQFLKEWQEMGMKIPLLGAEGFHSPKIIQNFAPGDDQVFVVGAFDYDQENRSHKDFLSRYSILDTDSPDVLAAQAFDATLSLGRAILAAQQGPGFSSQRIVQQLEQGTDLVGLVDQDFKGFDARHEVRKAIQIHQLTAKKWKSVASIDSDSL